MKFIKALQETEESIRAREIVPGMRSFKSIYFGDLRLSIQASEYHYCTPRKTVELDKYEAMEFALMSNGEFIRVSEILPGPGFEEIEEYFDQVYAYAPVELIEEVYQKLVYVNEGAKHFIQVYLPYEEQLLEHYRLVARYVKHTKKKASNLTRLRSQEFIVKRMKEAL